MGGSRFRIQPDPPQAGKPLEVTYIGPADAVEYQVDDETAIRRKPDANGKFVIDPLPSGQEIMFTDNLGQPGYLHSPIAPAR
jgi:hypothetical protein